MPEGIVDLLTSRSLTHTSTPFPDMSMLKKDKRVKYGHDCTQSRTPKCTLDEEAK